MKELIEMQTRLRVPKTNEAKGSNGRVIYKYRSCEDILEACRELQIELRCSLTVTDEVVLIGNRFYIKATATITNEKNESKSTSAYAREPESLASMNQSQVTGAASSYARKYALNGLLAIDDTKDADTLHDEQPSESVLPDGSPMTIGDVFNGFAKPAIEQATTKEGLKQIFDDFQNLQSYPPFTAALTARRKALGIKNSNEQ